jgi:hypothetical protein
MLSAISLRFFTFTDRFLFIPYPLHAIDELLRVSRPNVARDFSHIVLGCCSCRIEASHVHLFCNSDTVQDTLCLSTARPVALGSFRARPPAGGGHFAKSAV